MEKRAEAFILNNHADSIGRRAVVVAGIEVGVVVSTLQLQARFQDFGWYV